MCAKKREKKISRAKKAIRLTTKNEIGSKAFFSFSDLYPFLPAAAAVDRCLHRTIQKYRCDITQSMGMALNALNYKKNTKGSSYCGLHCDDRDSIVWEPTRIKKDPFLFPRDQFLWALPSQTLWPHKKRYFEISRQNKSHFSSCHGLLETHGLYGCPSRLWNRFPRSPISLYRNFTTVRILGFFQRPLVTEQERLCRNRSCKKHLKKSENTWGC